MRTQLDHRGSTPLMEAEEQHGEANGEGQLPEFFRELFIGCPGESETDRSAREDAARGIFADLLQEAPELAAYAMALLTSRLPVRQTAPHFPATLEAAA